jgi:hypothetical protein
MRFNARVEVIIDAEKDFAKPAKDGTPAPLFVHVGARACSGVKGADRRNVVVTMEKTTCPWRVGDRCKVEETFEKKTRTVRLIER